jgi:hypothetical protein
VGWAQEGWMSSRRVSKKILEYEDTMVIPILVFANKQDREDCVYVVGIKDGIVKRISKAEQGIMVRGSTVLPVIAWKWDEVERRE